jgi:hypothetical protein
MIYPGETGLDLNCDVHERIIFALFVTIYGEKTISAVWSIKPQGIDGG